MCGIFLGRSFLASLLLSVESIGSWQILTQAFAIDGMYRSDKSIRMK